MTTIVFEKDHNGTVKSFTLMGHVGYARKRIFVKELDIVCSAVSALTFHTLNGLSEVVGEEINVTQNEDTGFIRCILPDDLKEGSKVLLSAFELSLSQLQEQYGDRYLSISNKEVNTDA